MCIDNGNKKSYSKEQKSVIIIGQTGVNKKKKSIRVRSFPKSAECEPFREVVSRRNIRALAVAAKEEKIAIVPTAVFFGI